MEKPSGGQCILSPCIIASDSAMTSGGRNSLEDVWIRSLHLEGCFVAATVAWSGGWDKTSLSDVELPLLLPE